MSTATHVPETSSFKREELDADDAWVTARRVGTKPLLVDTWRRMRYGDGFSSTRAIAFQFVLALVPLLIAFIGLASTIAAQKIAKALQQTVLSILPGSKEDAWGDTTASTLSWLRWPIGALLGMVSVTTLFRWAPRRRQPGFSWLAVGAAVAFVLWVLFSLALSFYVSHSQSFGTVYGPLTGMFALLLWSQLTSLALLFGIALAAQLEAVRAGVPSPVALDPEQAPGARTDPVVILTPERASP
jgi:uncharacterized BrkB/YihY/UPF0761 family membrane protein